MPKKKELKKSKAKKVVTSKTTGNIGNDLKTSPKKIKETAVVKEIVNTTIPKSSQVNIEKTNTFVEFWKKGDNLNKVMSVAISIAAIAIFATYNFYYLPEKVLPQTDSEVQKQKSKETEDKKVQAKKDLDNLIASEDKDLNFNQNKDWQVELSLANFGDLKINLKNDYAPKTVENFIRLVNRGYFNSTPIHRIVKTKDFAVIQGGDKENKDGSGGRSAFYIDASNPGNIPDELWTTKPAFESQGEKNVLTNTPVFRSLDLYKNFDPDNGTVEYAKGLILMAKTSSPDSASSQFFITLDKTILPAQYTVFGVIDPSSIAILDKINTEVKPLASAETQPVDPTQPVQPTTDGKPDKAIVITVGKILKPEIKK